MNNKHKSNKGIAKKMENSIFHSSQLINYYQIESKSCSKTSYVNTLISPTNLTISRLKLTVQMEVNNVSPMRPRLESTRQKPAKITHFWDTAHTETSANLRMEIMNWTQFIVETFTRQKNVKTFGTRDFVFMEFAVSFCIRSAQSLQVNRTRPNT